MRTRRTRKSSPPALRLKPSCRRFLKKPLGNLLSESKAVALALALASKKPVVAVGDVTALLFFFHGIVPSLSVVDLRVRRKPLHAAGVAALRKAEATKLSCSNPAGTISLDAMRKIKSAFSLAAGGKKVILFVQGEEDLLFLSAVLHAPAGSLLFYGQPGKGVVAVEASAEEKQRISKLVKTCFLN